jgi:SPP1 family predicted phage head-tail adaptor
MRVGELNRRVTIQSRAAGHDADGQASETWADVLTCWAAIRPLGGRELLLAKSVQAESTHEVTMRYRTTVDASMRIVYEGRIFNITNLNDVDTRHQTLVAMCVEGINKG